MNSEQDPSMTPEPSPSQKVDAVPVGSGDWLGPIYLVVAGFDYEGSIVKAILRTFDEAEAVAEKYRDPVHFCFDTVRVVPWHIGEITDRRWEKPSP